MANVRYPQNFNTRAKRLQEEKKMQEQRNLGYLTAIITGAAVLNDCYDMYDIDIQEWAHHCVELMQSVDKGTDDWNNILRWAEKTTNVSFQAMIESLVN